LDFLVRFGMGIILFLGVLSLLKIRRITTNQNDEEHSANSTENGHSQSEKTNNDHQSSKSGPDEQKFNNSYEDKDKDYMDESGKYDSLEFFYSILKVNKNSSLDEIKKAYREEIKKYHPDKVDHLSDEFRAMANKRTIDINRAYNYLLNFHKN